MMKLTREEAIANHRKMWNWIADETERWEDCATKRDYFNTFFDLPIPLNECYCCEYAHDIAPHLHGCYCCSFDLTYLSLPLCGACPINWGVNTEMRACLNKKSPYAKWVTVVKHYSDDWKSAAKLAREIANLPERGDNHQ